jgi:signal peptidase
VTSFAEQLPIAARPRSDRARSTRASVKRTWEMVSIVLVIVACIFWAMFLRPQSLGGSAGYILVSGQSMEPLYHTGDLILVERSSTYAVGDIIAYRVPKGDPMAGAQVIHRIVGGNATRGFVVQGDNRTAPDVWHPKQVNVVGAAQLRIPDGAITLRYVRSPLLLGLLAASFVFVYLLTGGKKKGDEMPASVAPEDVATSDVPSAGRTALEFWEPKQIDLVGRRDLRASRHTTVLQFAPSPLLLGLLGASAVFLLLTRKKK